jgi:riboflavin synthase
MYATKFHVGDRVEDKKTHKRGRVTFVYSELERKGEVIEVLFDGRDEAVDARLTAFAKSQRSSHECRSYDLPRGTGCLSRNAGNGR